MIMKKIIYIAIVGTYVIIPEREGRVDIITCRPDGVGRNHQIIYIFGRSDLIAGHNTLRNLTVQKIVTTGCQLRIEYLSGI